MSKSEEETITAQKRIDLLYLDSRYRRSIYLGGKYFETNNFHVRQDPPSVRSNIKYSKTITYTWREKPNTQESVRKILKTSRLELSPN